MIEFDNYIDYKEPVVTKINDKVTVAMYTDLKGSNDIVAIHSSINNTILVLYNNTYNNIYKLLNRSTRKKIKNKRKKV